MFFTPENYLLTIVFCLSHIGHKCLSFKAISHITFAICDITAYTPTDAMGSEVFHHVTVMTRYFCYLCSGKACCQVVCDAVMPELV